MMKLEDFNYRVSGNLQGIKIVFLHGLMGFLNNWGYVVRRLNETHQCLVYDQRGHGKSIKPLEGYAPEDYSQDLRDILFQLGWEKVILVGHSMGGRNALCFANFFSEYIEKLVIVDISPDLASDSFMYYKNLLDSIPAPFASNEAVKKFFSEEFLLNSKVKGNTQTLAAFLMANLELKENGLIDWRFSKNAIVESAQLGRNDKLWGWFRGISVPCLYIRGEHSEDLSRESFQNVLECNSNIRGVEIANAGHWVHSEQPENFLITLRKFIQ